MQAGFSTLGCPDLDLAAAIDLAQRFGLSQIELRVLQRRLDLPALLRTAFPDGWQGARALLDANHIKVPVIGSSFKLLGYDEAARRDLLEQCELAIALGAPYVRVFSGGEWGQTLPDTDINAAAAALRWWQGERDRAEWNVELLVETHSAFSASAPCVRLADRLDGHLGVLWDCHHTWLYGGEPPEVSWAQLQPFTRHVHVKDSRILPGEKHEHRLTLPGQGDTPVPEVLRLLAEDHFAGVVSLEWERMWVPDLPPIEEALAAAHSAGWW